MSISMFFFFFVLFLIQGMRLMDRDQESGPRFNVSSEDLFDSRGERGTTHFGFGSIIKKNY